VKTIAVVGAGYVGLVTGACFAQKNNKVIVVENNAEKVQELLKGHVPFYEPGLDDLVRQGIEQGTLIFVENIAASLAYNPSIIFSCVGTPSLPSGAADLSYVWQVAKEIGQHLSSYCVIVNKSTVPVGTAQKVKAVLQEQLDLRGVLSSFDVVSNPEFLKEGDALNDFLRPERVVIGTESEKAFDELASLYAPFVSNDAQIIKMSVVSAELTKYASNAMLATRISFMNQVAQFADAVGADIEQVKLGMSKDKRIGAHFLNAGIGYGGSCFPKDVKALINMGNELALEMSLIKEVDRVNDSQRQWFIKKILTYYGHVLENKKIGIWGLAFKPETDDIRSSPALDTINVLLQKGAVLHVYDPVAMPLVKLLYQDTISYAQSADELLSKVDCLVVLTEWKEFLRFQPQDFTALKDKVVFDGRNCFDPVRMSEQGITYHSVGRAGTAQQVSPLYVPCGGDILTT
jgi:UDPglucose 6-dehydrogenase